MQQFYFLRHGETDWNRDHIYQGQNDIPLNETGRWQAAIASQKISQIKKIDAIFSSPLSRAKETAEIVRERFLGVEITEIAELIECQSVAAAKYILMHKGICNFPSFEQMPQSSEEPKDFIARIKKGLQIVLDSEAECPLIVAHGGTCTAISMILDVPIIKTPNCCIIKYEQINGRYQMALED